jgi:peptidoglycan hydrolase-like protein with peptidoglycan-binding domain
VEIEFWRSIKDTNKLEELDAYLLKFPNGQFAPIARSRLATLKSEADIQTAVASSATENALGFDADARRDVQRRLTAVGFQVSVSGQFADATRRAIANWQTARGYPKSGYLNKPQHQALLQESVAASAGTQTETRSMEQQQEAAPRPRQERSKNPVSGAGEFISGVLGGAVHGIGSAFGKR